MELYSTNARPPVIVLTYVHIPQNKAMVFVYMWSDALGSRHIFLTYGGDCIDCHPDMFDLYMVPRGYLYTHLIQGADFIDPVKRRQARRKEFPEHDRRNMFPWQHASANAVIGGQCDTPVLSYFRTSQGGTSIASMLR